MSEQREQKFLDDALRAARLTTLPKAASKSTVWIEGIAKIRLANNGVAYGVVRRKADLGYNILCIFGETYAITEIEEVYPYVTLDKERIKKFDPKAKEEARANYLKSLNLPYAQDTDFSGMTIDELNREIVKAAVYSQLGEMEK